ARHNATAHRATTPFATDDSFALRLIPGFTLKDASLHLSSACAVIALRKVRAIQGILRRKVASVWRSRRFQGRPRIRSAAFSAIIGTQALIWAETKSGMAEASTTRSRSMPRTLSSSAGQRRGRGESLRAGAADRLAPTKNFR